MITRRILAFVVLIFSVGLMLFITSTLSAASSNNPGATHCGKTNYCTQVEVAGRIGNSNAVTTIRDPDLEPGFPVKALHYGGTYHGGQGILTLVGNIDSDPELEIIVTGIARGPFYAWNPNGSLVAGWPITDTYYAGYPGLGNLSHNSVAKDVFVGYFYAGQTFIYSGNGVVFSGWPQTMTLPGHPPTLVDIDNDGLDEIFMGESSGMYRMFAYKADGSQTTGLANSRPDADPCRCRSGWRR